MKVTVLGAITGTGRQVVRQLLDQGHDVTAFFRPSGIMPTTSRPVREVRADPGNRPSVRTAIAGADAVICPVGCTDQTPSPISAGLRAVLDVMQDTGVRRLVAVSGTPAAPGHQKSLLDRMVIHPVLERFSGDRYSDLRRVESMLAQSDSDWTVFRPPHRVTEGPATGNYRTSIDSKLRKTRAISRADLASALVRATEDDSLIRHFVTISY